MSSFHRSSVLATKYNLPYIFFGIGVIIFLVYIVFIGFPLTGSAKFLPHSQYNADNNPNLISLRSLLSASVSAAQNGGSEVYSVRKSAGNINEKSKGETREGANDPLTDGDIRSHNQMYYGFKTAFPNLNIISEEHSAPPKSLNDIKKLDLSLRSIRVHGDVGDVSVYEKDVSVWIDPLDATKEYTENLLEYVTTMVCVAVKGVPVIGIIHKPFEKLTVWAWVGKATSETLNKLSKSTPVIITNAKRIIVSRSHAGAVENITKTTIGAETVVVPAGGAGFKSLEVASGKVDAYIHTTLIKKWDICAGNAILNALGGKMTTLDGMSIDYSSNSNVKNEGGLLATLKNHDFFVEKLKSVKKP